MDQMGRGIFVAGGSFAAPSWTKDGPHHLCMFCSATNSPQDGRGGLRNGGREGHCYRLCGQSLQDHTNPGQEGRNQEGQQDTNGDIVTGLREVDRGQDASRGQGPEAGSQTPACSDWSVWHLTWLGVSWGSSVVGTDHGLVFRVHT